MTRLTAIVPATNAPPTLAECVRAIREATDPPDELIVIEEATAAGPAAARNDGAALATGDVLVFVDADVVPAPDAFTRIRQAFEADRDLDALFGSYDATPAAPGVVSQFRNLLHHHIHSTSAGPATTFWAGLGAVRRDAFVAVGGFDAAAYPEPSVEDIELGLRLRQTGSRLVLDPRVRGTHLKRWTLSEMLRIDFGRRGAPWTELILERRQGTTALNLGWRHRLSAAASLLAVAAACRGRPRGAAVGLGSLVVVNARFYRLLLRRQGLAGAVAGIGLHTLHHLTGVAAAGTGAARVAARRLTSAAR